MTKCESCGNERLGTITAVVKGKYYSSVCSNCLASPSSTLNSTSAGYERRRGYEDNAQDTIQPYDAAGPNPEFYRLYPKQSEKVFSKAQIEELKRKI
jgi:hypothetical protein